MSKRKGKPEPPDDDPEEALHDTNSLEYLHPDALIEGAVYDVWYKDGDDESTTTRLRAGKVVFKGMILPTRVDVKCLQMIFKHVPTVKQKIKPIFTIPWCYITKLIFIRIEE